MAITPIMNLLHTSKTIAILFSALFVHQSIHANLNFMLFEEMSGVLLSGSGSFDPTGYTEIQTPTENPQTGGAFVPNVSIAIVGTEYMDFFDVSPIATGPSNFGSGSGKFATSGTGVAFGFDFDFGAIFVPQDYVANSYITGTGFYEDESFASLGVTPGTYKWELSDGQTVTLTVVPEPTSIGLSIALLAVTLVRRRRRSSHS
jgi:hypothetical protein